MKVFVNLVFNVVCININIIGFTSNEMEIHITKAAVCGYNICHNFHDFYVSYFHLLCDEVGEGADLESEIGLLSPVGVLYELSDYHSDVRVYWAVGDVVSFLHHVFVPDSVAVCVLSF